MAAPSGDASQSNGSLDIVDDVTFDKTDEKRIKCYPDSVDGPFTVFVRQINILNPIKVMQVSAHVASKYRSVQVMKKVNSFKMRIVLADRTEANRLVQDTEIGNYRVYVPHRKVEIDGVVMDSDLDPCTVEKYGIGKFKNRNDISVPILEVKRLYETDLKTTRSLRITFAGSVLPDQLVLDKVIFPIRLYYWRPMHCEKCQKFGHTHRFCTNKSRCAKCGKIHDPGQCPAVETLGSCYHCKGSHDSIRDCPKYQERLKELRKRHRDTCKASYASIVTTNEFDMLSEPFLDECNETSESDNASDSACATLGKRKKNPKKPPAVIKHPKLSTSPIPPKLTETSELPKLDDHFAFPNLKRKRKVKPTEPTHHEGISFQQLVTLLCNTFQLSSQSKAFVISLMPILKLMWLRLCEHVPILQQCILVD